MKPTKILWTCRECGAQAVTEKRPDTVTIEAYCPQHVVRTTVVP